MRKIAFFSLQTVVLNAIIVVESGYKWGKVVDVYR